VGRKLAVDLCNQSTATKGNLEGIFGVISYWGEKRSTANIETFVFYYLLLLLTSCKEGGWQSIRHNKHKIFYEGITGSVTIISRLIASEFYKYRFTKNMPNGTKTLWH